jgi:ankyrin repeat protein
LKNYLLLAILTLLYSCSSSEPPKITKPQKPLALSKYFEDSIERNKIDRCFEVLEEDPVQIYALNKKGQSPLHLAALRNRFEVLEELLRLGSPVDLQNKSGDTSLHLAAYGNKIEAVKLLMAAGADPNIKNKKGENVIHKAAVFAGEEIFELIFLKSDTSAMTNLGKKPLHVAARYQNLVFCQLLLESRVDENPLDHEGNDPLMACLKGLNSKPKLEELLVSKCSNLDFTNKASETYMHAAATTGKHLAIQALLDKGADIDPRDKFGVTPLVRALRHRKKLAAKTLADNGANLSVVDNDGRTVLHFIAVWMTEKTGLKTYIDAVDINAIDKKGRSALHEVAYWAHAKNAAELIAAGAKLNIKALNDETPIFEAIRKKNFDMVKLFIEQGADLTVKNLYEDTPLKVAITGLNTDLKIVEILLENGANVNAVNIYQESIVHEVVRSEKPELLELMLRYKPDLSLKDRLKKTPLDWARERNLPKMEVLLSEDK